jgi:hypothetical protein
VFSFTEGFLRGTRQRALCRVPEIKHSAKNMALGKEPNSGSVRIAAFSMAMLIHSIVGFTRYTPKYEKAWSTKQLAYRFVGIVGRHRTIGGSRIMHNGLL